MTQLINQQKHITRCQARENLELVSRAGNLGTSAKRGKTWSWCQGRETSEPVPNVGKLGAGVKGGKPRNQCQARENLELVSRAGKRTYSVFQLGIVSQSHSNYSDKSVQTQPVSQSELKAYTRNRRQARKTREIINWLRK